MESIAAWNSPDFDGDDDERALALIKAADAIDSDPCQSYRADTNFLMARAFDGQPMATLLLYTGRYFSGGAATDAAFTVSDNPEWNVARAVCMTLVSMVGKNKPVAQYLTTDGDYDSQRLAEAATAFAKGWAHEANLYEETHQMLLDAVGRFDLGAVQVFTENGRVGVQRVLGSELRSDPLDSLYGKPRTLYRRRFVPPEVVVNTFLKGRFKGKALEEKIAAVHDAATVNPIGLAGTSSNLVRVEESWSKASAKDAGDGLHMVVCGSGGAGVCLFREEWKKTYHPIVVLRYEHPTSGYGGISLMMQLYPMQEKLTFYLERIDRSIKLLGVTRLAIQRGSKIVKPSVNNAVGALIEFTTEPPVPISPPIIQPEVFTWVENVVNKMYAFPGINRDQASGQKDTGTKSGEAIREALDVQGMRIQTFEQSWERAHMEIFRIATDMWSDVVADGGSYEIAVPGKRLTKKDWKDVALGVADTLIQVMPVSGLPDTPQGRLDYVQDAMNMQLMSLDQAKEAMGDFDPNAQEALSVAPYRYLERVFKDMLYDGVATQPDLVAISNVAMAATLGVNAFAKAANDGVPDERLELMRRYLKTLQASPPRPPAQPAAPAPQPQVQAA